MMGVRMKDWLTPEEQARVNSGAMDFDDAYSIACQRQADSEARGFFFKCFLAVCAGVIIWLLFA